MRNKVVTQFSVAVLRYAKEEKKNIFDAFPGVSVKKKKKVLKTVFAELWRTIKKKHTYELHQFLLYGYT